MKKKNSIEHESFDIAYDAVMRKYGATYMQEQYNIFHMFDDVFALDAANPIS